MPVDFKEIGKIDPEILNPVIELFDTINWNDFSYRRPEPKLRAGKLLALPYLLYKYDHPVYTEEQQMIIKAVEPVVDEIIKLFPGYVKVRGEIATLLPGVELPLHTDIVWFHKYCRRIHIPIITNKDCYQQFENRTSHLEFAKIYEINNRIMHGAGNLGNSQRIHLILDLLSDNIYNIIDKKVYQLMTALPKNEVKIY